MHINVAPAIAEFMTSFLLLFKNHTKSDQIPYEKGANNCTPCQTKSLNFPADHRTIIKELGLTSSRDRVVIFLKTAREAAQKNEQKSLYTIDTKISRQ
jgi:hypothetical protein